MKWRHGKCVVCGGIRKVAKSTGTCFMCSHPPVAAPILRRCKYCRQPDLPENMHKDIYTEELYHESCGRPFLVGGPAAGIVAYDNETISEIVDKEASRVTY